MPDQAGAQSEFLSKVFPAELEEVSNRRENLGMDGARPEGPPSTEMGLTGLALSGGGIRSATISLGVIQALAGHGLLKSIDYLSTVSGGGFIGSCLTSLMNDPKSNYDGVDNFPLRRETGVEETRAVRHLRNSSNYLAPRGFADTLRVPTVMVRGILINLLAFLPVIMAAALITEVLYEVGHGLDHLYRALPVVTVALFLFLVFTFPVVSRLGAGRFTWNWRNGYEALLTWSFSIAVLLIVLVPLSWVVGAAVENSPQPFGHDLEEFLSRPGSPEHLRTAAIVIVSILLLSLAIRASAKVSTHGGKLIVYAFGLLGPLALFGIYLFLCLIQVDSHFVEDHRDGFKGL